MNETIAVQESGHGVRVVLVHGSLVTGPEEWEGQQALAGEGYRLVVPDRRGYGDSPQAAGEDFLQDGKDIAELLGDGAHLVGHSYGGLAALVAAEQRPEAVLSLSLLEPAAFSLCTDHPAVATMVADLRCVLDRTDLGDRACLEAFLRAVGSPPEDVPEEMLDVFAGRFPALRQGRRPWGAEADVPLTNMRARRVPTLVISGGHHPAWDAICTELARQLNAQSATIAGAGHEIQMMAEPCNRTLMEFWRSI
ncbi:MAG: alpha/beta hydrolase [Actinomycetia bacterium]|nr:alpha/beta hydrolase [Actinomycetes bacterium]